MEAQIIPTQNAIAYKSGYKYQTDDDYTFLIPSLAPYAGAKTDYFEIVEGGGLYIYKGYAWDGASGPTWDSKSSMRASLVHDVLYQCMRLDLVPQSFREEADIILQDLCVQDGMWKWRAALWFRALDWFGGANVKASRRKKIHYAP